MIALITALSPSFNTSDVLEPCLARAISHESEHNAASSGMTQNTDEAEQCAVGKYRRAKTASEATRIESLESSRPVKRAEFLNRNLPSTEAITDKPYKYRGNIVSNKFHRPWCPFSQAMNVNRVILFHFRYEAIAHGLQPCHYCLPPLVLSVKCRILHNSNDTNSRDSSKHRVLEPSSVPQI
jgi:hypothetical protein